MFEPTIKYKRVNNSSTADVIDNLDKLTVKDKCQEKGQTSSSSDSKNQESSSPPKEKANENEQPDTSPKSTTVKATTESSPYSFSFEEEEEKDSKISVDPNDKERIIVTLSTGKQFSADRYCPHAGADLAYHGKVSEDDYPPEIGPVLMCPIHYWEFALEKGGKGGRGFTSINACPVEASDKCLASAKKKLDW